MNSLRYLLLCIGLAVPAGAAAESCPGWRDPVGKRIVGGDRATINQWPSLAVLRLTSPNGKNSQYQCGGSAIARDWVLTAAHCFDDIERLSDGRLVSTAQSTRRWVLDVVLGTDDLVEVAANNAFAIAERTTHEAYVVNGATRHGQDIALVRLKRPWEGPLARLSLAAATDPSVPPGAGLMVAGFGLTKGAFTGGELQRFRRPDGGAIFAGSRHLLHVGLPLVAQSDCASRWSGRKVSDGEICAGYESGVVRRDSCSGDSGGPLNVYDRRGCPIQVGLVSWGTDDCGLQKAYGVYARVSYHADWLRRRVPDLKTEVASEGTFSGNSVSHAQFLSHARELIGGTPATTRIGVRGRNVREDRGAFLLKNGGTFELEAHSEIGGRLIIVDVNADGVATQIFPNQFVTSDDKSLIKPSRVVVVPGPGYGFDHFRAEPPLGKGRLIALVVPADFPVDALIAAPDRIRGIRPERSSTGYFMNLLQQITAHISVTRTTGRAKPVSWAVASTEYEIVP